MMYDLIFSLHYTLPSSWLLYLLLSDFSSRRILFLYYIMSFYSALFLITVTTLHVQRLFVCTLTVIQSTYFRSTGNDVAKLDIS